MTVDGLNTELLFEVDLEKIKSEYEKAKQELKSDIDYKIAFDKLKKFIISNINFVKKFDISKKRITVIEDTAKKVIAYVEDRLRNLRNVSQIPDNEIKPLIDYLDEFKSTVKMHTKKQTEKYNSV